jgi:hypothetical protein
LASFRELSGNAQFHTGFVAHTTAEALRDPDAPGRDWQFGSDTSRFPEFRLRFSADAEVQKARSALLDAETAVKAALT